MNLVTPISETAETVTLSRADYDAILDALDDQAATSALKALGEEETFPSALVDRILDGENPVRAYRAYRGLTVRGLAEAASLSPSYVSDIESGKKAGSIRAMKAIAGALGVDLDDLV